MNSKSVFIPNTAQPIDFPPQLRTSRAAAKAYLQRAVGGAMLFFLYDELIYPTFSQAFGMFHCN